MPKKYSKNKSRKNKSQKNKNLKRTKSSKNKSRKNNSKSRKQYNKILKGGDSPVPPPINIFISNFQNADQFETELIEQLENNGLYEKNAAALDNNRIRDLKFKYCNVYIIKNDNFNYNIVRDVYDGYIFTSFDRQLSELIFKILREIDKRNRNPDPNANELFLDNIIGFTIRLEIYKNENPVEPENRVEAENPVED